MDESAMAISSEDRVALLRQGIVVVVDEIWRGRWQVGVTGFGDERVFAAVHERLGQEPDVMIHGDLPRRLLPRRCVGHREREAGRLQVRFVISYDEHVDDIVVAEDAETVVVLGTVCTAETGDAKDHVEVPCHVYLDRPLGNRAVIDGATGKPIPYKNVQAPLP
jgi:hypothetical protein